MGNKLEKRLQILEYLKEYLENGNDFFDALMQKVQYENPWFAVSNMKQACRGISAHFLDKKALESFVKYYSLDDNVNSKNVGIIMAGNIPLVGFHDWLCCFISGHHALIKLSKSDNELLKHLLNCIEREFGPGSSASSIVDKLVDYQAVIATGSNNTNRYFEYYFRDIPRILRKNRTSVAVCTGLESDEDLIHLGRDVLDYFGHGCRSVSKIYVPRNYDVERLMMQFGKHHEVILNQKYKENYDYNYAMWSINRVLFYTNGSLIFREDENLFSRIASVHFEYYDDVLELKAHLQSLESDIQCIVGPEGDEISTVSFGNSQSPGIRDYSDGIDTMQFLLSL